jgi:hypothetical protein
VAALKGDLEGILPDQSYVFDTQLFCIKVLGASKTSRDAGLAATLCAWACPSQLLGCIGAVMSTLPRDLHDLTFAVDVDG